MKIAIINDTHCGIRNSSDIFIDNAEKFYSDIFFPYLLEHSIRHIIHLGDYYDNRKFINFRALHRNRNHFLKPLREYGLTMDIIRGNHDTYYKNTGELNSLKELLGHYMNEVTIIQEPKVMEYGSLKMGLVPWIDDDNSEESLQFIENVKCDWIGGHFDIVGYEMMQGLKCEHGLDRSIFKRFEQVLSGHFHKKSDDGQIYYLGTQYEITWSDYKCPKGFHILDTETRELTRVPNPMRIHKKLIYNDKDNDYMNMDLSQFKDTFVKVFVTNKTNEQMFNNLIDRLHNTVDTHEVNIIEDLNTDITASVKEDILEQGEDTLTFLGNYVEQIDSKLDKHKLKSVIKDLYTEASER